jgi:hypothetical protein
MFQVSTRSVGPGEASSSPESTARQQPPPPAPPPSVPALTAPPSHPRLRPASSLDAISRQKLAEAAATAAATAIPSRSATMSARECDLENLPFLYSIS